MTDTPLLRKHRYRVGLAGQMLVDLFKADNRSPTTVVAHGLPDDARAVDVTWDGQTAWLWFATDEPNPGGETPNWPPIMMVLTEPAS